MTPPLSLSLRLVVHFVLLPPEPRPVPPPVPPVPPPPPPVPPVPPPPPPAGVSAAVPLLINNVSHYTAPVPIHSYQRFEGLSRPPCNRYLRHHHRYYTSFTQPLHPSYD